MHSLPQLPFAITHSKCKYHEVPTIRFRSVPNAIPTPKEWAVIQGNKDLRDWELHPRKQSFASAYDMVLKLQLHERFEEHKKAKAKLSNVSDKPAPGGRKDAEGANKAEIENSKEEENKTDFDRFIRIFGAPVFRLVSDNWARLVVRRSFDLDLLEWRSKACLNS